MQSSQRRTKTDDVYERIRADIFAFRLKPGQRLKFPELCAAYGTSVGVAREALARLTADRFVRPQAHLGFTVADLSADELADLTLARVEVESLTFRLSITHGDAAWEASLVAAHHLLSLRDRDLVATGKYDGEWHQAHEHFHAALLAACPSGRLVDMATALRAEGELYRQWAERSPLTYQRDVPGEHRALLEAALAHDADRAADLMREHISLTSRILLGDADLPLADVAARLSS